MTRSTKIAPLLVAVGLLAAACTSSGSGGSTPSDSSPPSTVSTASGPSTGTPSTDASTSSGGSVPSTATLQAIVVQSSDLPSGWTGKPAAAETNQDQDTAAKLAACVGSSDASNQHQIQQVQSDDFSMGQSTVSSDASSYPSQSDVLNQVSQLQSPKAQPCLNTLFKQEIAKSLPATATIKNIGIKLTTDNLGSTNLAGFANGSITVVVNSKTINIYIGAGFYTGHQITGSVTFTSIGTPISSSFANPIVLAVAKRAASA